ncbi:RNA-binding ATPase activator esf2 [Pestalotiopsis sp. 9143b]|nr:RNA-binding ATPase activator esf2 [Pestalotiopsis sp. 9143b]
MPAQKRNNFLDAEDSDDDVRGYESEEEVRKGSAKRRRMEDDDSSEGEDDVESIGDDEKETEEPKRKSKTSERRKEPESGSDDEEDDESAPASRKKQKLDELPGLSKPFTKKNLVATEAAIKKSGVVYISRVPPFMKPQKLRSLLEPYGTINRIFLSPEDPTAHSRRVKNGGNKKRSFTDGWVEFVKKKDAKAAVDLLRGQVIGGKKGSYYRDDLWSLSYLKGFKWHNLTEQISAEAAEKSNRMRAEISKSTKENKEFVQNVERAKMLNGIQEKKKQKEGDRPTVDKQSRQLTFEQSAVARKPSEKLSEGSKRVASMLF